MPNLGGPELFIVLILVVIVFGAGKLPEAGSALGKSIKEFRKASDAIEGKPDQDEIARETERTEKGKTV